MSSLILKFESEVVHNKWHTVNISGPVGFTASVQAPGLRC